MTEPGRRPRPGYGDVPKSYPAAHLEQFMDEILDFYALVDQVEGLQGISRSEKMAMAAGLAQSFRDWQRETKRVRRKQRELQDDDYADF